MKPHLKVIKPSNQNRTVPVRRPNAELRKREYLTPAEINKLIAAAKRGRYGHRDATLILVAYRHGLRAIEVADLEWSRVEWDYSGDGAIIYQHACALGCEGILSKRLGSPYRAGRADCWLKVKNPAAPAVKREAEEDWDGRRRGRR